MAWRVLAGTVVAGGIPLALGSAPPLMTLATFATIGLCATVLSANFHLLERPAAMTRRDLIRRIAADTIIAGAAGAACHGYARTAGPATIPVVTGLIAVSPSVLARIARFARLAGTTAGSTARRPTADEELAGWTDGELYAVWCSTGTRLVGTMQAQHGATAAEARQHLLSEFERRYPAGTSAWLDSDAILSGEPPRFLIETP